MVPFQEAKEQTSKMVIDKFGWGPVAAVDTTEEGEERLSRTVISNLF